jgi:hypothetical protein
MRRRPGVSPTRSTLEIRNNVNKPPSITGTKRNITDVVMEPSEESGSTPVTPAKARAVKRRHLKDENNVLDLRLGGGRRHNGAAGGGIA